MSAILPLSDDIIYAIKTLLGDNPTRADITDLFDNIDANLHKYKNRIMNDTQGKGI